MTGFDPLTCGVRSNQDTAMEQITAIRLQQAINLQANKLR